MTAQSIVSLGDIAEFIRGINFKPEDVVPVGTREAVACLRTANVQTHLDLTDVWAVPKSFVKRAEQFVKAGDILVSSANSWNLVGKCCWIPELPWQTSFGGFVSVLRPNPKKVEPRFLYRWFASTRIQALLRSFGRQTTNISNLDVERSLQLELPLPSLHEQRRIVDILDKADGLRAKRRSALEKLSDLTQSIFLEMFGDPGKNLRGWKCAPLASVSTIFGEYGSGVPSIDFDPSLPRYVRITDINDEGRLVHSRVSPGGSSAQWDTLFLEDGDILFARSGATVGKTFKYKSSDGPCVFAGYLIRFRTDRSRLLPDTLFHFTRTSAYAQWVAARQRVVAQPNINAQQYGWELTVPLPPVRLQLEFSRLLQTVEATFNRESQAVSLHDGLFASLQHQAFSGAL